MDASRIDIHSATWQEVSAWAQAELDDAREEIESPMTNHDRSQLLRGHIERLKALLALPSSTQPKMSPSADYA